MTTDPVLDHTEDALVTAHRHALTVVEQTHAVWLYRTIEP